MYYVKYKINSGLEIELNERVRQEQLNDTNFVDSALLYVILIKWDNVCICIEYDKNVCVRCFGYEIIVQCARASSEHGIREK